MSALSAVLLAAGTSSRMGTAKALLRYPPGPMGEPLVRRVARALAEGGASPVVVVVGPDRTGAAIAASVGDLRGAVAVVNPEPGRGMLSSVQAGAYRALREGAPAPAALLVCPCDLPKLQAAHVAAVARAWDGDEAAIVAPTFAGSRGHPTLFGQALARELWALDPEECGLNELLRRRADRVREIALADDAILRDADTPREWRALGGAMPEEG